jgi:hypothetical protein
MQQNGQETNIQRCPQPNTASIPQKGRDTVGIMDSDPIDMINKYKQYRAVKAQIGVDSKTSVMGIEFGKFPGTGVESRWIAVWDAVAKACVDNTGGKSVKTALKCLEKAIAADINGVINNIEDSAEKTRAVTAFAREWSLLGPTIAAVKSRLVDRGVVGEYQLWSMEQARRGGLAINILAKGCQLLTAKLMML